MNASALEWKTAAKFEPLSMGVIRLSRNSIPESKIHLPCRFWHSFALPADSGTLKLGATPLQTLNTMEKSASLHSG